MKNILIKGLGFILVLSLLISFAACKNKGEENTTTEPYSYDFGDGTGIEPETATGNDKTNMQGVKVSYMQIPDDLLISIIESDSKSIWDGDYAILTSAQKAAIERYFDAQGKEIEFMDDGVYEVVVEETTTAPPVTETKPGATTTAAGATTLLNATTAALGTPTSVALSDTVKNVKTGTTFTLNAAVLPAGAKNKTVSWRTSNPSVAVVSSTGLVKAKAAGAAVIICEANGAPGIKSACNVTVTKAVSAGSAIYKYDSGNQFYYFENGTSQRKFALESLYGSGEYIAAANYNAVQIKFNYGGLDWLVRLCKGQYGQTYIGSEIGVYTKPENSSGRYECASDNNALSMNMSTYLGSNLLFSREYKAYWWLTGYTAGTFTGGNDSTKLTMVSRITLKDRAMTNAFVKAFSGQGFTEKDYNGFSVPDRFRVSGNNVYFNWKYIGRPGLSGKINFYTGGGSKIPFIRGVIGEKVTAPANPVRTGYIFSGWSPSIPATYPKNDLNVKALWTTATTAAPATTTPVTTTPQTTVPETTAPGATGSETTAAETTVS